MSLIAVEPRRAGCRAQALRPKRVVRIGLLGLGRVGSAVAELLAAAGTAAARQIVCTSALVRRPDRHRSTAVRLEHSPGAVLANADVIVEALGGVEPARAIVARALDAGLPVVTANKTLVAHHGPALQALAARRRTSFTYEAAVLAGVPFLGALRRRPFAASVARIDGVLNGTSQYVLGRIAAGATGPEALSEAVRLGYAEPDATSDLSGRDAAEKLTILLHTCGCPAVRVDQFTPVSIAGVSHLDCRGAWLLDGALKPVASARVGPQAVTAWVGPAFVPASDPMARLEGVDNLVRLTHPSGRAVTFAGPGAGPEATAATLLDDVLEIVNGRTAAPVPGAPAAAEPIAVSRPTGRWFVRAASPLVNARDVAETIGACGLPAERLLVHGGATFALARPASAEAADRAVAALRDRGADVLIVPVL